MMASKRSNTVYYVLGSLAVLFGLFMYWAASDIPLPKNAKKVGDMVHIDISEGATNEVERKEALFVVPERFKPGVSEGGFAFYFKFPDGTPYTGNESPVPFDSVRVVIRHYKKTTALHVESILRKIQAKDGLLKNVPYFVEKKDELEIYQYDYGSNKKTIGTYFKFVTADGSTMLVDDAGDWSHVYEINGKLSPHVELLSMPSKKLIRDSKHFIEDITAVDNAVHKLVQSFQSK
jgi:hypothetical protein